VTYLITFACYGCHLRGPRSGSVDPMRNVSRAPWYRRRSSPPVQEGLLKKIRPGRTILPAKAVREFPAV